MLRADGRAVVPEGEWLAACDDQGVCISDDPKNRRDVVRRTCTSLVRKGQVVVGGGQVWLSGAVTAAGDEFLDQPEPATTATAATTGDKPATARDKPKVVAAGKADAQRQQRQQPLGLSPVAAASPDSEYKEHPCPESVSTPPQAAVAGPTLAGLLT